MENPDIALTAGGGTPAYVSPSIEVLETLELQSGLSALEARLDSFEIDLARLMGSREDALNAFAQTAEELRQLHRALEKRIEEIARARGTGAGGDEELRAELRAGIDGVMAGVGDVLESMATDVRKQIDGFGDAMIEIQAVVERVAATMGSMVPAVRRMEDIQAALERLERTE